MGNGTIQSQKELHVTSDDEHVGTAVFLSVESHEACDPRPRGGEEYDKRKRLSRPSVLLKNFVTYSTRCSSSKDPVSAHVQSTPSGIPYPIANYVTCANLNFSAKYRAFLTAVTITWYSEAVKEEKWREAMKKEIEALERNGTWELEILPPGKKAIGCKWVYKTRYNSDGIVKRDKAHLVIYGNRPLEGIDYNEMFAPVAKMVTVRTFLSVAVAKNWELHQMDVHNAFLHGDFWMRRCTCNFLLVL